MKSAFETQWQLYRHGGARPPLTGEVPRGEAEFDGDVRVGQIRLFADTARPFTALVLEDRGLIGRRLVPLSPFRVPASTREFAWGGHVFQLWNACTASRRLTDRSWLVDELPADVMAELIAAVPSAQPGRLTAGDGVQARYEREFLVAGGTFMPFGRPTARPSVLPRLWGEVWKVALSAVLCVGAFYFIINEGLRRWSARHAEQFMVRLQQEEGLELTEVPAAVEPALDEPGPADVALTELAEGVPLDGPQEPSVRYYGRPARPLLPGAPALPGGLAKGAVRLPHADGLVNPSQMPLSMLELGGDRPLASCTGTAAPSGAASRRTVPQPRVTCRVTESPWDPLAVLVNIRSETADGGLVEVYFDKTKVRGYRLVAGGGSRPLNAFYEAVLTPSGAEAVERIGQVTVRWPEASGERRRLEPLRRVDLSELTDVPANPHAPAGAPSFAAPDDVTVETAL